MRPRNMGFDVQGGHEHMVGEDQLSYMPCPATVYPGEGPHQVVAVRWTLTATKRQRVAAGEDLVLRMPDRLYPHSLMLLTDAFGPEAS